MPRKVGRVMSREADRRAQRAAAKWGGAAVVCEVVAFTDHGAPTWLRVALGVLSLVNAFFAGLVAIPSDEDVKR